MPIFSGTSQILEFMKGKFLTLDNYEEWSIRMKWVLVSADLWDVVQEKLIIYIVSDKELKVKDNQAYKYIMLTIDDTVCSRVLQSSFLTSKHLWEYLKSQFGQSKDLLLDHGQQDSIRNNTLKKMKGTKKSPIFNLPVPEIHDDHSVLFGNLWDEFGSMSSQNIEPSSTKSLHLHLLEEIDRSNLSNLHLQHEVVDCRFLHDGYNSMKQVHETFYFFHGMADPERSINKCAEDYLGLEILHLLYEDLGEEQSIENLQGAMKAKEEFLSELPWIDVDAELSDSSSIFIVSKPDMQLPYAVCVNFHGGFACPHATPQEDNSPICLGFYSYEDEAGFRISLAVHYTCLHENGLVLLTVSKCTEHVTGLHGLHFDLHAGMDSLDDCASKVWHSCYKHRLDETHLFQRQFQILQPSLISKVSKGTAGANAGVLHDYLGFSSAEFLRGQFQFFKPNCSTNGMYFSTALEEGKRREWYRGRKIWFKTNTSWQSWLLLWLVFVIRRGVRSIC